MKRVILKWNIILAILLGLCSNVVGQNDAISKQKTVILRAGTPITLALKDAVTSRKDFSVGTNVGFYVLYDVVVDGEVAIPSGTPVYGSITSIVRPKGFGNPGKLTVKIDKVQAIDNTLMMLGGKNVFSATGDPNVTSGILVGIGTTFEVVGLLLYWPFSVIGLPFFIPPMFMKGSHAEMGSGTQVELTIVNTAKIKITNSEN